MDDLIRRQDAIDVVEKWFNKIELNGDICIDGLISLPPAQQWIQCSERLPEEPYGCLVTVWDTDPFTMDEFENILPYFVGWDGETWNDGDGEQCPFEVIAWMPLPEPYKAPEPERDCEHCVHHTDKGCSSWDCEFEKRH